MKKLISVFTALTVTLWLTGGIFVLPVSAAYADGDLVRETDEFDVYIVKLVGAEKFKRLILNPDVFNMYGHLEWGDIQVVADGALADYATSELVRADGDEKVYKLYPDGDVGTKKWVETLDCFVSQGFDWDSVYIINSFDRDSYTTASVTLCGGAVVEEGDISLSLAADSPDADTIPPNVQGVTYLKVDVAGSGTISQITVKRLGAGAIADFNDIYIYENGVRLTSGRSISSSTSKVTFINLGLEAPTTLSVVADMADPGGATNNNMGNVNYFAIESADDVTSDATVGGVFPLEGRHLAISATDAGTLVVARAGTSSRNVTIGDTETEISQFKVTVSTEGANLERIQLFNTGDASNTLITNLKLKDNTGTLVASADSIGDDGYVAFVFDELYYIKKGDSEIFHVYADIGGVKPDRTIILYLELSTDVLGKGTTYGYGMAATITAFNSDYPVTVTCKGGDLTINKTGPNAGNIGTDTDDTVFLEFTMTAAADITIKRTRLLFCEDEAGDGTYDSYASATYGASNDIEDIKIVDKDTGTVIVGPKDGTAFNDGIETNGCAVSRNAAYENFTDTFDIGAGESMTLQVTADVKSGNTGTGRDTPSGAAIKFYLYSYASLAGNVNNLKYTGTTDAVAATAIAPSGNIAGEEMTVSAASLAISLSASPAGSSKGSDAQTYIIGQDEVTAVGIIFTAGESSDVTINSINLTAYIQEQDGSTDTYGVAAKWLSGADVSNIKDSLGNIYIYDKTTGELVPGSAGKGFSGGSNELVEYSGLSWTIPAGEDRTLLVKADISSASPASGAYADIFIAFDIEGTADVSAVDKDGNSVDLESALKNGGHATTDASVSPNTDFGIAQRGSVAILAASDTPDKSFLVMGSSDNEVSKFKLTGTNEGWYFSKFSIDIYDGSDEAETKNLVNVDEAKLKYQTEAQWGTSDWTISAAKTFGSTASLAFTFSGDARPYVPKDDDSYISVLLDILDYSGGTGAKSKQPVRISHIAGSADSFKAYGAQSGYYLTELAEPTYSTLKLHYVARSYPVFAKKAWSGGELEMARFTITAEGYDVIFDGTASASWGNDVGGDIASAALRFGVIASSTNNASISFTLYDWNENIVASIDEFIYDETAGFTGTATSITFSFEEVDVTVPAGTTKEFHVDIGGADIADFNKTDEYIYLELKNDASDLGTLATGSMGYGERFVVWHDGTLEEGISDAGGPEMRYGMPEDVLGIGLPITFRTLRGTGTP